MDVRASAGASPLPIHDEARAVGRDAHELALRLDRAAPRTGAHRLAPARCFGFRAQEEASDSQMMARWRSRASSPMSTPVDVASASIGVFTRSSGE